VQQLSYRAVDSSMKGKMYSLKRMCELIEAANCIPSKAKKYLTELEKLSKVMKDNLETANQNFKDSMNHHSYYF